LHSRFVQQPDRAKDTFENKFRRQLAGAPANTIQLAAEMLFVYFLASDQVSFSGKKSLITEVLSWSPEPAAFPGELEAALNDGIGDPGVAFNTKRPMLLWFLLDFASAWKRLPAQDRVRLLEDPWAFKTFVLQIPGPGAQTQQQALLHL